MFAARLRTIGVGAALAIGSFAGFAPAPLVAATGGATIWHVQAGNVDSLVPPIAHEFTAFYGARITVHAGDDVLFSPVGGHTVTFNPVRIPGGPPTFAYADPTFGGFRNNPLRLSNQPGGEPLNSGEFAAGGPPPPPGSPPPPPTTYTLKIDSGAAGPRGVTYQYFCMFHREMTGWITVLPAAAEGIFSPALLVMSRTPRLPPGWGRRAFRAPVPERSMSSASHHPPSRSTSGRA
jgi:plastocyanin